MKEKKKLKVPTYGSLRIDPAVLLDMKKYCKDNGILITHFATEALRQHLQKVKSK